MQAAHTWLDCKKKKKSWGGKMFDLFCERIDMKSGLFFGQKELIYLTDRLKQDKYMWLLSSMEVSGFTWKVEQIESEMGG